MGTSHRAWAACAATALALACAFAPAAAFADENESAERLAYEPGEVLIVQRSSLSTMSRIGLMSRVVQDYDVEEAEELGVVPGQDGAVLHVKLADDGRVEELMGKLADDPAVAVVQRNVRYYLLDDLVAASLSALDGDSEGDDGEGDGKDAPATNDPSLSEQYYLDSWDESHGANVIEAWKVARCEGNVTIAILDTGARVTHEDLAANLDTANMKDIVKGTAPGVMIVVDEHGTHTAGIAGAVANNGLGIAGASYNANILPIQVFATSYSGDYTDTAWLIQAYDYLLERMEGGYLTDLHVVNMSLGGYGSKDNDDLLFEAAIQEFRDDYDILTVCAGGNGDDYGRALTTSSWPSDYESSFAVTALSKTGTNTAWSDYNSAKDISAPGEALYSSVSSNNSAYATMSGTSMASPLVAGIAALLWAVEPDLTADQVVEALVKTAHDLDPNGANYHSPAQTGSAGAVDAAAAVKYVEDNFSDDIRQSLRYATVTVESEFEFYTGSAVEPAVKVVFTDPETGVETELSEGSDYVVSYRNNVAAGMATATVSAAESSEEYRGSQSARFPIYYNLSDSSLVTAASQSARSFTGRALTPLPRLSIDGTTLVRGTDFTVSYEDNIYGPTGHIVCEGMGNCKGSYVVDFAITGTPQGALDLQDAIAAAQELLDATAVSEDGSGLEPGATWAPEEAHDALAATIAEMQETFTQPKHVQADFETALDVLASAQAAFEDAVTTVPVPEEPDGEPNEPVGPTEPTEPTEPGDSGDDAPGGGGGQPAEWKRLAGDTALDTMLAIVRQGFSSSDAVVIATVDGYWDALAASALAGKLGAPVLLTASDTLSSQTASQVARLGATHAYIVGGTAAVSSNVEHQVKAALAGEKSVTRLAGENAQETAAVIATAAIAPDTDTCVIATSAGYWDALSASPFAYAQHAPIYLTDAAGELSTDTLSAIRAGGYSRAIVAGGTAAVSVQAENDLRTAGVGQVVRQWGEDAYATSGALAVWELGHGLSAGTLGIATAGGYWDALCGSALCGSQGGVLLLVDEGNDSNLSVLRAYREAMGNAYVFGGTAAVSASVEAALRAATA